MSPNDAECAGRLAGLIDKTLALVLAAPTDEGKREAIARALTDALDIGLWWAVERSRATADPSPLERMKGEETRRATRPGYLRPKK